MARITSSRGICGLGLIFAVVLAAQGRLAEAGAAIVVDIRATSPTMQTVGINQQVPNPFAVQLTTGGNPLPGLSVDFSNGCFNFACFHIYGHFVDGSQQATAVTDSSGIAVAPGFVASDVGNTESGVLAAVPPQLVAGLSFEEDPAQEPLFFYVQAAGGIAAAPISAPTLNVFGLFLLAWTLFFVAYVASRRSFD